MGNIDPGIILVCVFGVLMVAGMVRAMNKDYKIRAERQRQSYVGMGRQRIWQEAKAQGRTVMFPKDDCWQPPNEDDL